MRGRLFLSTVGGLALIVSTASADVARSLEVWPASVKLRGPAAAQRLVVDGTFADGTVRDLTASAEFRVENPAILSLDARKHLRPKADGKTRVIVKAGGVERAIDVEVAGSASPRVVSFKNEVQPILTKLGCNQGACHGSQHGKGGFRLSLLGFEPDPDHTSIVKSAEGRRVTPFSPEESLLLLKPTLKVGHGGGKKLEPGSDEDRLLQLWLEQGAAGPSAADPEVVGLSVFPSERVATVGDVQNFVVMASWSDGSVRDVTDQAKFDTLNEGVVAVDRTGVAKINGQGEANVMVRYMGRAAMARLTVPYARGRDFAWTENNVIDAKAARKWRLLGLIPSDLCTDAEFLRRAMLDTIGTLPTPEEIEAFLADRDPNKRSKMIDKILDRPEYVEFWTLKWGDLLRVERTKLGVQGMLAFNLWLRESFRDNKRFDKMINELVTAQGSIYSNGPANYFRVSASPDDLAETTSQVFLGVRLQCAKCHHHPYEAYGQDDYYGLAAYFARIKTKNSDEFGLFGREQVIYVANAGEVRQPRSGKQMKPTPLNAPSSDDPADRRRALARWLTDPKNPWTGRNIANRYWGYLMGTGLVNPIDDLRETNPPTNPELLDALSDAFVKSGYDFKALLRLILNSRTYQLSSIPNPDNRLDTKFFTHYQPKRLGAETLLDAVNFATGTTEKFLLRPEGTRAISLPDPEYKSDFLDTFGRPVRAIACECERGMDPNLSQALAMMNSTLVNQKISLSTGRIAGLLKDKKADDEKIVRMLYLLTFSRPPEPEESALGRKLIAEAPSRTEGVQDLFWALMNSKEFLFNH